MFEDKYLLMQTISTSEQNSTSIVKDNRNQYFICKKIKTQDPKTRHEINLMKTLHHPNIIHLHEIIEEEEGVFIIQEYCQEGDLEYYLKRQAKMKKKIPQEVVARWMLQVLLAIQYLHHARIIHRDIRPKNIFLNSTGNIKLGSFKTSKVLEAEVSYARTLINSSYYLTPEVLEGKKYDQKVDIWAFGCVLYEVCSLRPLVNVINLAELMGKGNSSKGEELPSSYSKQLNSIYLKCMKKNPAERVSAPDLLKTSYFLGALEKFIGDEGLNITLQERIPIKKYKIHRYKYERLKLKRGLVKDKQSLEKKESLLPRIEPHANSLQRRSRIKSKDKEKVNLICTPVLKRKSLSKEAMLKNASTEKKKIKTESYCKSRGGEEATEKGEGKLLEKLPPKEVRENKFRLAPPLLPKPLKKPEKAIQKPSSKATKTEQEIQNFETTMSKESLSRQLANFQKKDIKQINENLNKIFAEWKLDEEEEIQFQFEEENELRLTSKASKEEADSLLQTVKSKLEQLIEEINYKYCPDMQPIAQKTQEFDSKSLSHFCPKNTQ